MTLNMTVVNPDSGRDLSCDSDCSFNCFGTLTVSLIVIVAEL